MSCGTYKSTRYVKLQKLLLLPLCMLWVVLPAQTIKRWSSGRMEIKDKSLPYESKTNIFKDYWWTYAEIKTEPVTFIQGKASFSFKGNQYTAERYGRQIKIVANDGSSVESSVSFSEGEMFYDKSKLQLKSVEQQVWTTRTVNVSELVPVQQARKVEYHVYKNGELVPATKTEYFIDYQYKSVPKTEWYYKTVNKWVPDIPQYAYYAFTLSNGANFVLYEGTGDTYYLQNCTYLIARDKEGLNHLLVDADNNGSFLDDNDKLMFNSWNPYSPESAFKSAGMFKDNKWYTLGALRSDHFLNFELNEASKTLNILCENSRYSDEGGKGKVTFSALPAGAELFINGTAYELKKETVKFKTEYGKFNVRIVKPGNMDFETVYTVNEATPEASVAYQPTPAAGKVEIQNIYEKNYFVTVTGQANYTRTYINTTKLNVPLGKGAVSIYSDGFTLEKEYDLTTEMSLVINFEKELDKLKSESTE